jgi:Family of unknown function (DUF6151)
MPVDLPLRCQCGLMRGVARDVSPSAGLRFSCYCKDCQAFARYLERADMIDPAGGTDIFQMPPARVKLTAGTDAMRCLRFSNRVLRWYTECCRSPIANTAAGPRFPGHRRGSFLHGPCGRRPFPGRGARSAALPPLRAVCRRAAAAERTRSAVARGLRRARVKDFRLVGARAQPAHAVFRRSHEGSARRAARAHAERARRSLTCYVTASSLRHVAMNT